MRAVRLIALHALRESVRRRVFLVVLVLTVLFLALFAFACGEVFHRADFSPGGGGFGVDQRGLAVATLLGLGMFATLFLGTVLAVFLTLGAVRGDAERGTLQPLVVRPLGRPAFLLGRLLAATVVCAAYVVVLYALCLVSVKVFGHRWPDRVIVPGLALVGGVVSVAALSLLGSVYLSATANGIAVFMVFGAGLVGGLLQSIADALSSSSLAGIARAVSLALPFEALYQAGLHELSADAQGLTRAVVKLGPFGSARAYGAWLALWVAGWLTVIVALALRGFARRDL